MDLVPREYKRPINNVPVPPAAAKANFGFNKIKISELPKKLDYLKFGIIASALLLFLSLAIWGGLKIYSSNLSGKIEELKKQESSVFESKDKDLAEKIADLEKRAKVAQDFFETHVYTSEILDAIASQTLPKVKWDSYDLSVKNNTVTMKGQAVDYSVLAKQIFALEEEGQFSNIVVSGIALDKAGSVNFNVSCSFDPKILQK
jgi:hypothetical protein